MPLTIKDIELLNSYQDRITAAIGKLADIAEMLKSANHPQSADYTVAIAITISQLNFLSRILDNIATDNMGEETKKVIEGSIMTSLDKLSDYQNLAKVTSDP